MQDYRKIRVWSRAQDLSVLVYRAMELMPEDEKDRLVDQLKRAVNSISETIAEGAGRTSRRDFGRYLRIALGSTNEVESDLLLCRKLGFLPDDVVNPLIAEAGEVRRMLVALIQRVRAQEEPRARSRPTRTPMPDPH